MYVHCRLLIWHRFLLFRQIWNTLKYIFFSCLCSETVVRDFVSWLFSLSGFLILQLQRLFDRFAVTFDAKNYVLERRFALNLTPLSVLVGSTLSRDVGQSWTWKGIMFFVKNHSGESCHTKWNTQGNPVPCWKTVWRIMSHVMKHPGESCSLLKKQSGESCPAKWNTQGNPFPWSQTVGGIISHEMKHSGES